MKRLLTDNSLPVDQLFDQLSAATVHAAGTTGLARKDQQTLADNLLDIYNALRLGYSGAKTITANGTRATKLLLNEAFHRGVRNRAADIDRISKPNTACIEPITV